MFEEINTNISFSIEGTELKVTGNIFVDGLSHSLQAVEEKVYPILSLKAQENGYEVDWHENPLYDSEELKILNLLIQHKKQKVLLSRFLNALYVQEYVILFKVCLVV